MSTSYQVIVKVEVGAVGHAFMTLVSPNQPPITIGYYPVVSKVEAPGIVRNDALTGTDPVTQVSNSRRFARNQGS